MAETTLTGYPVKDRPWHSTRYYTEEVLNLECPRCSMYELIYEANKDYPDEIALQYLDIEVTYREFFENVEKTAAALTALGVKEDEIVTLAMPNTPEVVYLVYALNHMGAVANLIHPLPSVNELHFYLKEVQSRFFFMYDGTYDLIRDTLKETPVQQAIIVSPAASLSVIKRKLYRLANKLNMDKSMCMEWDAFIKMGKGVTPVYVKGDAEKLAIISHTGGTTGEPKGVMLSNHNMNAEVFQIVQSIEHDRQGVMIVILPPFVNYSFTNGIHEPLYGGLKCALIPKYEPLKYHEYHAKYQPNYINSIPQYCIALLKDEGLKDMDLSSLKLIAAGGEAMDPEMETKVNDFLHAHGADMNISKGYGSTEMVSAASFTHADSNILNCCGVPLHLTDFTAVDVETREPLPYNEKGELLMSGPTLFMGYYNNPEATDAVIEYDKDGRRWMKTGDIGYIDEAGRMFITGRIKRILITKGPDGNPTKMFPDRIEATIQKCKKVALSCVIGLKDEDRIHIPKAFVELVKDVKEDREAIREEILAICREKLPSYQVPEEIEFLDELPRTERGKIDYRALGEESDIA